MKDSPYYDYDRQCWVVDGVVERCNHPANMNCKCYGKRHAGEIARELTDREEAEKNAEYTWASRITSY
jgi:hypothetical protein